MEWYLVWHEILHESMYALRSTLHSDMQYVRCYPTSSRDHTAHPCIMWILGTMYSYMISGVHMVGTYPQVSNTSWWSLLCSLNAEYSASMSSLLLHAYLL